MVDCVFGVTSRGRAAAWHLNLSCLQLSHPRCLHCWTVPALGLASRSPWEFKHSRQFRTDPLPRLRPRSTANPGCSRGCGHRDRPGVGRRERVLHQHFDISCLHGILHSPGLIGAHTPAPPSSPAAGPAGTALPLCTFNPCPALTHMPHRGSNPLPHSNLRLRLQAIAKASCCGNNAEAQSKGGLHGESSSSGVASPTACLAGAGCPNAHWGHALYVHTRVCRAFACASLQPTECAWMCIVSGLPSWMPSVPHPSPCERTHATRPPAHPPTCSPTHCRLYWTQPRLLLRTSRRLSRAVGALLDCPTACGQCLLTALRGACGPLAALRM